MHHQLSALPLMIDFAAKHCFQPLGQYDKRIYLCVATKFKLRQITFQIVCFLQVPLQIPSQISLYPDNVANDVRQFLLDLIAQILFAEAQKAGALNLFSQSFSLFFLTL